MAEPRHRGPPLFAALVDIPSEAGAAYGIAEDSQQYSSQTVPTAWRDLFYGQYADAAVWSGKHSSCRLGRDFALTAAPTFTVQLQPPQGNKLPGPWKGQLSAVERALRTRGTRGATLRLLGNDVRAAAAAFDCVTTELHSASAAITHLELRAVQALITGRVLIDSEAVSALLQRAATAFTHITALTIHEANPYTLPPPSTMPHLKHFTSRVAFTLTAENEMAFYRSLASLAPYMPQLVSIDIDSYQRIPWEQALTPASTSHTLRSLKTGAVTTHIVALLLDHAPALKEITCGSFHVFKGLSSDDFTRREWNVSKIDFRNATGELLDNLPKQR